MRRKKTVISLDHLSAVPSTVFGVAEQDMHDPEAVDKIWAKLTRSNQNMASWLVAQARRSEELELTPEQSALRMGSLIFDAISRSSEVASTPEEFLRNTSAETPAPPTAA